MEFVNAEPTSQPITSASGSRGADDSLEALAESLLRGGVLSAQDAAELLTTNSDRTARQRLVSEAVAMRAALRNALETVAAGARLSSMQIATINAVLDLRRDDLRLVAASGGLAWGTESTDPLPRALALVALDGVALLTSPEYVSTVRRCAGLNCDRLFIDLTKNRSGRWCEMRGCGNRAKARRFHERRRVRVLPAADASQADGVP
jgi:predicted RNA-binding Zn ribbon-like protein